MYTIEETVHHNFEVWAIRDEHDRILATFWSEAAAMRRLAQILRDKPREYEYKTIDYRDF